VRIVRVHVENFRGIKLADIYFEGTTVLLGDNNTGKSTVFEAIELAIGADRLARTQAIDEHDFYGGDYRAIENQPPKTIVVEVVVAGLDEQHCTKFRNNLEFWRIADRSLLGAGAAGGAGQVGTEPAVRVRFEGAYLPSHARRTARPSANAGQATNANLDFSTFGRFEPGTGRSRWSVARSSM
jgi:putative ATP-dependent endonuclease of OLD family